MSKRPVTIYEYDRIKAIKRHPEFRRELAAWQDLFERERMLDYRPTQQDLDRNYEPRSYWSALAELEASRYQFYSTAEDWHAQMKADPGIAAFRTLMPKNGPDGVTITIPPNQPVTTSLRMVERVLKAYRELDGIADTQPLKPTEVDPWFVWDAYVDGKTPLLQIAQKLADSKQHPAESTIVKAHYYRVKRAYERAKRLIAMIDAENKPSP